ncbi:MAG: hypothetical protein JW955_10975 [Sedimentisphaerales bacterium]|nr:hypothetical protein [Sedimentisphaerales bacterium]
MRAVRIAALLGVLLTGVGDNQLAFAQQYLADSGFDTSGDSTALRANSSGQDWYESRQDSSPGPTLLTLDTSNVGGNSSKKAKLTSSTANPGGNAYLTQEFSSPQTGRFTAQWRIYVDSITNISGHPDCAGWMMIGDDSDSSSKGPNASDSERFVYMAFLKNGGGTSGTMDLVAMERYVTTLTPIASNLSLDRWYTIRVDVDPTTDSYDVYIDGKPIIASWPSRKVKSSVTHISFAQWNDGAGTFYVDDVTAGPLQAPPMGHCTGPWPPAVEVYPENPTPSDNITLTFSYTYPCNCPPYRLSTVTRDGSSIYARFSQVVCVVCDPPEVCYSESEGIGRLPAGCYDVYVNDAGGPVPMAAGEEYTKVFTFCVEDECRVAAVAQPATNIQCASATLNGRITDDGGEACQYKFRLIEEGNASYQETSWTGSKQAGESFSWAASDLKSGVKYCFAVKAQNSRCESAWSSDQCFTTGLLQVETQAATAVTCSSATLNGKVTDGGGVACQYKFRYRRDGTTTYTETAWTGSKTTGQTFSQAVTGLSPTTRYYFAAKIKNPSCESPWGTELNFMTVSSQVETQAATDIKCNGATLNGRVVADGGEACQYRFRYRRAADATYSYTSYVGSKQTGETFSQAITGLEPWTRYYFAAQIKNSGCESAWGSELNFLTTLSVETRAATDITCTMATLNGRIADDGGAACQYKFRYKKDGDTTYTETAWTGSKRTGETFSQVVSGLSMGTKYYFAAKAKNGTCETPWGTELTFTTMKLPTATAQAATAIGLYSATLNGKLTDDGGGVCQYRFRYRKEGGATYTQTDWTGSKRTGATLSQPISGLSQSTKYFFAAQAKNAECGEGAWSSELSFTTLTLTKPTVTTLPATNVREASFTTVGKIVKDGNDVCQYRFRITRPLALTTGRFPPGRIPRITALSDPGMTVDLRYTYTSWTGARRTGESFSEDISSLDPNTTYHIAAQAKNAAGESAWGEEVDVKTLAIAVIKDLRSRHSSTSRHVYFLNGVSLFPLDPEKFTVKINWAGLEPGKVQWRTPKGTYEDTCATGQTEVSRSFDMGTEFGVGGKLQVRAVPKVAGKESAWVTANFTVMAPPPGVPTGLFIAVEEEEVNGTAGLGYITTFPFFMDLFGQTTPGSQIPRDLKGFGGRDIGIRASVWVLFVAVREGNAQFVMMPPLPFTTDTSVTLAGAYTYGPATLEVSVTFTNGKWEVKGVLTIGVHEKKAFPIGQWGPFYARGWVSVNFEAQIITTGWGPGLNPDWNGSIFLQPGLGIAGGIGIGNVAGCELYVEGGLELLLTFPGDDPLAKLCIYVKGGVQCYFLWWDTSWEPVYEHWCLVDQLSSQGLHGTAASSGLDQILLGSGCPEFGCLVKDPSRFKLMDRNYLGPDYAVWLPEASEDDVRNAGDLTALAATAEPQANTGEEQVLQSNVFKMSVPTIASDDDEPLLAWVYDDPNRSSINRTQIVFSMSDQGTWTPPSPIHDDGTGDFSPQLTVLPNGQILCAWENINRVLSDSENLTAAASAIDIAAASYDSTSGLWSTQALTNDSHMDRSPHIAAGDNNTAMVVWITNEKNDVMGKDATALNTIQYSLWDGSAWSKPGTAATKIGYMLKTSALAYDGTQAVYVYAIDADWDTATDKDEELYALVYDDARWSQPIRLTNDTVVDANPQVVYDRGEPLMVWYRDGNLVSCRSLFTTNLQQIIGTDIVGGMEFHLAKSSDGRISLVWSDVSPQVQGTDIFTATYDPTFGLWSNAYPLTSDKAVEKAIAVTYAGSDELALAYDKVEMTINDQGIPEPNQTSLCVLRHAFGRDVAVAATDITFDPANPAPGDEVQITAVIRNLGDVAEADVHVTFYHGDPNEDGVQIGNPQTIPGPIPAAGSGTATVSWTIPQVNSPQQIYVVTSIADDSPVGSPERTLANNIAHVALMAPDLTVRSIFVEATGYKARSITARIANAGAVAARNIDVTIRRDSAQSQVLKSFTIAALDANTVEELRFDWDISAEDFNDPEVLLYVVADGSHSIAESDENNNTSLCVVQVSMKGDVTDDGSVDETDLAVLTERWLDTSESPNWLPGCDLDHNGRIDAVDFAILSRNWHREAAWHTE